MKSQKTSLPRSPGCLLLPRTISTWNQRTRLCCPSPLGHHCPAGHRLYPVPLRLLRINSAFFDQLPGDMTVQRDVTLVAFHPGVINCLLPTCSGSATGCSPKWPFTLRNGFVNALDRWMERISCRKVLRCHGSSSQTRSNASISSRLPFS